VRLAAPPNHGFSGLAAQQSIEFVPAGLAWSSERIAEIQARSPTGDPVKIMAIVLRELVLGDMEAVFETTLALARWADVVVSHYGQPIGRMAAEAAGRPWVTAGLEPNVPSRHRPPPGKPHRGRWLNPLLWREPNARADAVFGESVNAARERFGLRPLRHAGSDDLYSRDLNLIAVSPTVDPPPRDWAPRHRMTGYWLLDDETWQPSAELAAFVEAGAKPIVVTLGGVAGALPAPEGARLTAMLAGAIERCGVRAVVQPGSLGLGEGGVPESMFIQGEASYAWLLPRASAAVHHAGAGTTAWTFWAGIPFVAVPKTWDQPYWAEKARRLGVSPACVPRQTLTEDALVDGIRAVSHDESLRERARGFGEMIRREDGAATAVRLVEEYMQRGPASAPSPDRRVAVH
jgi:UDP:flavonoid glycosyltransferase YjiC (YdhE family)